MVSFGILSPSGIGHLNSMIALCQELMVRGHKITIVGCADIEPIARNNNLDFIAIGEDEYPRGSTQEISRELGKLTGLEALKYNSELSAKVAPINLEQIPRAIRSANNIDALIIDQSMLEGKTIAEACNLPFVTICNALLLDPDPNIPPPVVSWSYDDSWFGIARNYFGYSFLNFFGLEISNIIKEYRQRHNLPLISNPDFNTAINSPLAVITQQPAEFDLPRKYLSPQIHFVGSLVSEVKKRPEDDFPWNRLDERPLIYASLGTIQNQLLWIYRLIAQSCTELNHDYQLVISLGGASEPKELGSLPGNPIVVKYAPQLELLQRATLCITHAGMNTTQEALKYGVPLVAIPITNDQPGVASRIAFTKTGKVVELHQMWFGLRNIELTEAIAEVLSNSLYKNNALKLQAAIKRAGGSKRAADIIEQAIATNRPVYRN